MLKNKKKLTIKKLGQYPVIPFSEQILIKGGGNDIVYDGGMLPEVTVTANRIDNASDSPLDCTHCKQFYLQNGYFKFQQNNPGSGIFTNAVNLAAHYLGFHNK